MSDTARVLVVEDNATLATVIRFNLARAGFRVTVARNGLAAWQLVQDEKFDVIVTDHQMPEMDGCEFCTRMRTLENYRSVPVILLTAKRLELDLARLRDELGVVDAFPKPFSPVQLVQAVQQYLAATP